MDGVLNKWQIFSISAMSEAKSLRHCEILKQLFPNLVASESQGEWVNNTDSGTHFRPIRSVFKGEIEESVFIIIIVVVVITFIIIILNASQAICDSKL